MPVTARFNARIKLTAGGEEHLSVPIALQRSFASGRFYKVNLGSGVSETTVDLGGSTALFVVMNAQKSVKMKANAMSATTNFPIVGPFMGTLNSTTLTLTNAVSHVGGNNVDLFVGLAS